MEVKERIISGARDLFMKFGVRTITMNDIAKTLGISKKTIYYFFDTKDSLVNEVTHYHLTGQEKEMEDIRKTSSDPVHEMLAITDYIGSTFQNMNPSLLYEIEKYFPAAWQIYKNHKQCCIHDSIVQNIKKGISEGLYRKEIDVEIISTLRMEEIQLAFNPFIFPAEKYIFSEVHVQLLDHFLHGICTLKGHKLINKYKQITEEE